MHLKISKKEKESPQSLIRRFTRSVRKSGILIQARTSMFRQKPKSREMKKRAALRREMLKREYEKKQKLGIE